jgi:hypothetical protein
MGFKKPKGVHSVERGKQCIRPFRVSAVWAMKALVVFDQKDRCGALAGLRERGFSRSSDVGGFVDAR